jgi:hypothetical protein
MLKMSKQQLEEMAQDLNMAVDDLVVEVKEPSSPIPQRAGGLLYISEDQDRAMARDMTERFISRTVLLLEESAPGWCRDKSHEDRIEFVRSMIEFARSKHIFKEINIQKLMVWQIKPGYTIPLSGYLESILNRESFYEEYRMEGFFEVITSGFELIEVFSDEIS